VSLVKSRELFLDAAYPIAVDTVENRTLMQQELHRHEYFEMLFVERGSLVNHFKTEQLILRRGDLLIMKPYVLHVLADDRKQRERKAYCCSFQPQIVDYSIHTLKEIHASQSPHRYFFRPMLPLIDEGISALCVRVDAERRRPLTGLFRQLRELSRRNSERAYALTRCRFLELLALLAELHASNAERWQRLGNHLGVQISRHQAGLRKTLHYIHDHFDRPLTLDTMARMTGTSVTYFCRLFKQETGLTFLSYVNGLRVERACVLLRDTCDSALDICYRVGFNDYTHFSRQFKRNTGISPAAYRSQNPHTHK
jgi:AraC-like DNA-binding protein/mannose-6-phosphate isomerase-like protein (cupin superfamily)